MSSDRTGVKCAHAPVFMPPQMCRDAAGLMLVSGPRAVFDEVQPHLARMTGEVWYVGEREDLAAAYKIMGNAMIFAITGGIADVLAIVRSAGIPPLDAAGLFSKFKAGSVIPLRAEKMANNDLTATFELTMARKDLRLMIEAAGDEPLAVLPSIAARMDEAIAAREGRSRCNRRDVFHFACFAAPAVTSARRLRIRGSGPAAAASAGRVGSQPPEHVHR